MPVPSKDNNVPFNPKGHFNVVCSDPTWVYHQMASGAPLNGKRAAVMTASVKEYAYPKITAGRGVFSELVDGGLFWEIAERKVPIVVEAIDFGTGVTATLVDSLGALIRAFPTELPAKILPGEVIKATGPTGAKVGVMIRYDGDKIL